MSSRLAEFICFYANRMSFQEVDRLLRKRCFVPLSSQTLHRITQRVAKDLDQADQERIAAAAEEKMPELVEEVDVYDPEAPEVLVMEDGILAKAQKPQRRADVKRPTRFIATDLAMCQLPNGQFQLVMESLTRKKTTSFTVADALRAAFVHAWGTADKPLWSCPTLVDRSC